MPTFRLLACLPCALLLTGFASRPDYPVNLNVLLQGEPMHATVLHGSPDHVYPTQRVPGYTIETNVERQPDGSVLASVVLAATTGGESARVVSPPLQEGQVYDAWVIVCTDPHAILVTGGVHGQFHVTWTGAGPACPRAPQPAH